MARKLRYWLSEIQEGVGDTAKVWLSVAMLLASFLLLLNGVQNTYHGVAKLFRSNTNITPEEISIENELAKLGNAPLGSLQGNVDAVTSINLKGLGEISFGNTAQNRNKKEGKPGEEGQEAPQPATEGTDRIGKYKDLRIELKGDLYEQLNFMRILEQRFTGFLFIKALNGNATELGADVRIYGE